MAVELGWEPNVMLAAGLARTVNWYRAHVSWWRPLKSERYV
jgi:dTDP-glucose 4,6-dehydratase